jgi:hypothetical protein
MGRQQNSTSRTCTRYSSLSFDISRRGSASGFPLWDSSQYFGGSKLTSASSRACLRFRRASIEVRPVDQQNFPVFSSVMDPKFRARCPPRTLRTTPVFFLQFNGRSTRGERVRWRNPSPVGQKNQTTPDINQQGSGKKRSLQKCEPA